MHVLQPSCGIDQLDKSVTSIFTGYGAITYELDTIYSFIILYEIADVATIHPLGYHRESVPFQINTNKR